MDLVKDGYFCAAVLAGAASLFVGLGAHKVASRFARAPRGAAAARVFGLAYTAIGTAALLWGLFGTVVLSGCRLPDCYSDGSNWLGVIVLLFAGGSSATVGGRLVRRPETMSRWLGPGASAATLTVAGFLLAA